jgi:Putative peptidoglycan binding domain
MRRKLRLVIYGLVSIVLMSPTAMVQAADSKGHFAFRGVGGQSCKVEMDQMQKDPKEVMIMASWLMGYLTAANREQSDTFDISPVVAPNDLLNAVAGLCRSHPDMPVESVFNGLLRVLSIARNRADTPIVETRSGKNTASVRTETLIAMQTRLVDYGYLKGKPDGAFGAKSEIALKTFQKDQKLPETGVADGTTIIRLLIELPAKKN